MPGGATLMNLDTAVNLAQLIFVIAQAIVLLIIFLMSRTFGSKKEVGVAHTRADNAHHRLDLLEQRVAQQPTDDDIKALRGDIAGLATDMRENAVRVETAVLGVKRIEDYLIGGKK